MKKRTASKTSRQKRRRIILSIIRTLVAIILLTVAIKCLYLTIYWHDWAAYDEHDISLFCGLFCIGLTSAIGGIYGLSPIVIHAFLAEICNYDGDYDKEAYHDKVLIKLLKWFVW